MRESVRHRNCNETTRVNAQSLREKVEMKDREDKRADAREVIISTRQHHGRYLFPEALQLSASRVLVSSILSSSNIVSFSC